MILLAVDPGESNGYVKLRFNADSKVIDLLDGGTLLRTEFFQYLLDKIDDVVEFVVEDFRVRPHMAKAGAFDQNRMVACQVIGALEFRAYMVKAGFHLQPASIKPVGYGFAGANYQKNSKGKHHLDALAHGVYYLVTKHGAIPPAHSKKAVSGSVKP